MNLRDWVRQRFGRAAAKNPAKWRKCPNCGIDVRLGEERCPNCGHDFRPSFQQDT